jgi:ABC-type multidrug transport system ATPase subunit
MSVLLRFDCASKSHWRGPHEIPVLSDISLCVGAGELVAVWGKRGAGKTTLARLAVGLDAPDRGSVRFGEIELSAARGFPRLLHEQIGWVRRAGARSEEIGIVTDYLILPLLSKASPRNARRKAIATLDQLGIADCADSKWDTLTDGQRTLVALAHALVREPALVIADDPTASLDVLQRAEVMRLLRVACDEQGLGVLVTVPDMPEMTYADQIAMLSESRLVFPEPDGPGNVIDFPAQERSA